jgi:hypothetical protein
LSKRPRAATPSRDPAASADFYGIDYLADYTATIETNTRLIDNPTRTVARHYLALLVEERDALHGLIGALRTDPTIIVAELNRRTATAQRKIHHLGDQITTAEQQLKKDVQLLRNVPSDGRGVAPDRATIV